LEAAASRRASVATSVGGNNEVIRDGISGYLVPRSEPMALSKALRRMEDGSPPARAAMGSAGREYVVKNYSLSSVLDTWESIYQSFMQKQSQLAYTQGVAS